MDLTTESDGGATLRLSHLELVGYYNLLNQFLRETTTWVDGSPIPDEVLAPQWAQLRQLSRAIGMPELGER